MSKDIENCISKNKVPGDHVTYSDEESLVILVVLLYYFPQNMTVLILKNFVIYLIVALATGAG